MLNNVFKACLICIYVPASIKGRLARLYVQQVLEHTCAIKFNSNLLNFQLNIYE